MSNCKTLVSKKTWMKKKPQMYEMLKNGEAASVASVIGEILKY